MASVERALHDYSPRMSDSIYNAIEVEIGKALLCHAVTSYFDMVGIFNGSYFSLVFCDVIYVLVFAKYQ